MEEVDYASKKRAEGRRGGSDTSQRSDVGNGKAESACYVRCLTKASRYRVDLFFQYSSVQ